MDELARWIAGRSPDRTPVVNKTGIPGTYKLKIAFSMAAGVNRDFADLDLFGAVEQQLGLKLQEARGPVASLRRRVHREARRKLAAEKSASIARSSAARVLKTGARYPK